MTSPGTWRVRTSTCAYLLITSTIMSGAATLFMMPTSGSAFLAVKEQQPAQKIGPGLTRMPPIDFGKPERVVSITPYVSHLPTANVQRPKRDVPRVAPPASLAASPAPVGKPLIIVAVARPEYRAPDIHRVY